MVSSKLRTYRRRNVTRTSWFHVCDETTWWECIILHSKRLKWKDNSCALYFQNFDVSLKKIFDKNLWILAFWGYIFPRWEMVIGCKIRYEYRGQIVNEITLNEKKLEPNNRNSIWFHKEIEIIDDDLNINEVRALLKIKSDKPIDADFISFDLDAIGYEEYNSKDRYEMFNQKINMQIPHIYYLNTQYPIEKYLINHIKFEEWQPVVLKSCNRCWRYLPINIKNEPFTLAFSLHCKKKAPCIHSKFGSYVIQNNVDFEELSKFWINVNIRENKVISYCWHQLECKPCKKFFVNAPLNPQRNAQQFKEDWLRRRAIEVLVDDLLERNLVHFEFKDKTNQEFSEYIRKKFWCKCFKCKKEIELNEMNLDHTMPLAYLYRLDETATCLCAEDNSKKSDHFPIDFYTEDELKELSKITWLSLDILHSKWVNQEVLALLKKNIVWFYDEFLMDPDYQKVRDWILTADKINDSLKRVIWNNSLIEEYVKIKWEYPKSVTIS